MTKQIIAFCGKAGSGKDYSSDLLVKEQGFVKVSFANNLRKVAYEILGLKELNNEEYTKLKAEKIYGDLNFRNILENLGESIRKLDNDFWANSCIKSFKNIKKDICVSDLRHANEYYALKNYCKSNKIDFKAVFCNYRSDRFEETNNHASAQLAQFLENMGYSHGEDIQEHDMIVYKATIEDIRNKSYLMSKIKSQLIKVDK